MLNLLRDPGAEPLLSFSELRKSKVLPRRGGSRIALSTIHRWATRGIDGVQLECVRVGGLLCSSEAALIRFLKAATCPQPRPPAATADTIPAADRAAGILDRIGL